LALRVSPLVPRHTALPQELFLSKRFKLKLRFINH
jgi:hypothetical protein